VPSELPRDSKSAKSVRSKDLTTVNSKLMSKEQTDDLLKFMHLFPADIQETALWLREFVWDLYPKTNELIYDSYNAVAFGWSTTDKLGQMFCGVGIYRSNYNIHFSFYFGSELSDPKKILIGGGKQYRYILVKHKKDFPKTYIKKLMKEAHANSLTKTKEPKPLITGATIIKAIYEKKRKHTEKKK
jgi:hypothetical protein